MELGPVESTGMDRAPLGWQSIAAWESVMAVKLRPWEARLLRRLSNDYLVESREAERQTRIAPWSPAVRSQHEINLEVQRIRAALRG